jgi:hypothetical protein
MHMQAQTIDARIVLTILAFVLALVVAVATPLVASATDEHEFSKCRSGGYDTVLECFEDTVGNSGERGPAAVARPAFLAGTLSDILFMELNMWGADFDVTPRATPYFPSPERDSIIDNRITTY